MQRHRIRPTQVYATVNRGIHAHLFRVYKNVLYGSTLGGVRHRFLELRAQSGAPERTHTLARAMSTATTGPAACARPAASTRTLLAIPSNSPMRRSGPRRRDDGAGTPRATVACEAAAHPQPAPAGATKPSAGCAAMAHTLSTHPTTRSAIGINIARLLPHELVVGMSRESCPEGRPGEILVPLRSAVKTGPSGHWTTFS